MRSGRSKFVLCVGIAIVLTGRPAAARDGWVSARQPDLSHDVIRIRISSDLVRQQTREFDGTASSSDCILGVPVTSTARTVAQVRMQTVPESQRAGFLLPVNGTVTTRSISDAGIVQVASRGQTSFQQTLRVFVSRDGISVERSALDANMQYEVTGISTSLETCVLSDVVLALASREVAASQDEASRIAEARERRRIDRAIESYTTNIFEPLNAKFEDFVDAMTSALPSQQLVPRFSSSSDAILATVAGSEPIAGYVPPPPLPPGPAVAQVHVSVVDDIRRLMRTLDLGPDSDFSLLSILARDDLDWEADEASKWFTVVWTPPSAPAMASADGWRPRRPASRHQPTNSRGDVLATVD